MLCWQDIVHRSFRPVADKKVQLHDISQYATCSRDTEKHMKKSRLSHSLPSRSVAFLSLFTALTSPLTGCPPSDTTLPIASLTLTPSRFQSPHNTHSFYTDDTQ